MWEPQNNFPHSHDSQPVRTFTVQKMKEAVGSAGDYSTIANCRTKSFCYISKDIWKFLRYLEMLIYSKISRGTLVGKHFCGPNCRCM